MRFCNPILTTLLLIASVAHSTIFASAPNSKAQAIQFSHISVNEGLSNGTVLSCCQDSLGHMWFATQDGLNRFDGYEFYVYRHNPEDTSIADNIIRKVYTSSCGNIWIGTESRLGKGGETIQKIQRETGTTITITEEQIDGAQLFLK